MICNLSSSHVVFQVVAFKNDLEALAPTIDKLRIQVMHKEKVGRYDFLVEMCEWVGSLVSLYICIEKAPSSEWIKKELTAITGSAHMAAFKKWEGIIDEMVALIGERPDHPMKNSFYSNLGCYQLAKYIINEVVNKGKEEEKDKSRKSSQGSIF
jgi:hypothetical protein